MRLALTPALLVVAGLVSLPGVPPAMAAAGDDTTVEARVDAARIGEGDSLTLTIEVKGSNPGTIEDPDLSGLADFTIGGGPSTSTSTSMVWSGGQASSTTSKHFIYILMPRRRGALTIPTISVRIGSRVRQTNPISVEVVEGRLLNRSPAAGRRAGPGIGPTARRPAQPQGDVIVEAEVDHREAFVGEQILLTYKVYTQVQLMEVPSPQRLPSHTGFWVEEIPVDPRATIHRVQRDGKEFIELTLMKKALFPTTSGELEIEETVFSLPVKAESQDPFDSIFFTPTSTLLRKTLPIRVRVKPLPTTGRPASFTGAVGSYSVSVQADRREAQVNDAVGLKVSVKGTGNIRTVGEPILPPLPDYKKFAPRAEEKKSLDQDRLGGVKTWDYVLSPLAPGHQDIPPIRFAWFDPGRAAYVETVSEAIPVVVTRGEGQTAIAGAAPEPTRREVTAFGRDIKYIKPSSALGVSGRPFHRSLAFAGLMAAPVLLNAGLLFMVRRKRHMEANADVLRGRRAPAFARRRLKEARRLLTEGKSREFHQEVSRALTGFLGDKLNIPPAGLTHQRIDELLAASGVRDALRNELQRCLEACDYARFAPSAPGPGEMQSLMDHAGAILARLEREIPPTPGGRAAGALLIVALLVAALMCAAGVPAVAAAGAGGASLFGEGNDHYAAGRFQDAVRVYRQLLAQGYDSEAVHYNLGNALFKSGQLGPAILEYEKAAVLAPNDDDVRANLEFVRTLTADKTGGAQTTTFFVERLLAFTTIDQDAVALLVLFCFLGALVAVRIVSTRPLLLRLALWSMAIVAVPLAVMTTSFCVKLSRGISSNYAIVLSERLDVRSGPGDDNTTLFTVHEGLKVRLRGEQAGWLQVSLENGLNGWVPASSVGVI